MRATSSSTARFLRAAVVVFAGTVALPASAADPDGDGDGIDTGDNCPAVFNPLQEDCNRDGVGDACNASGAAGADGDGDGVCDSTDNCAVVPNLDQGDCNANGVGDLCEGAAGNRDDDGDGVCNGVDVCWEEPGENACAMQALTVRFDPNAPAVPHPSYSGATHTLKGIARYGGNQFMWDFGDGSAPTAWTPISNSYNLGVNHVYVGAVGQTFIATLSLRSSAAPSVVSTATYRLQLQDSGPLAAPYNMDPTRMDVRIDMAVDQALWFLHTNMTRAAYPDGAPGFRRPYGYWTGQLPATCTALDAILRRGHRPNGDYAKDPYVETARRALDYVIASSATASQISDQPAGRPDYNLNGIGVRLGPDEYVSEGACLAALADAGSPDRQSLVGGSNFVRGRTYRQLLQDGVEWLAFGQTDSPSSGYRGGWDFFANNTTSANWYHGTTDVVPALVNAERAGAVIPRFVRGELRYYMASSRHAARDTLHGSWGYNSPNTWVNQRGAAAGLMFHAFEGDFAAHLEVSGALGFLYRYWGSNNYGDGGAWSGLLGGSIPMYNVATGLRAYSPTITRIVEYDYNTDTQTANGFDWYYQPIGQVQEGLATNLVRRQAADGSWTDTFGYDATSGAYATGLDILILDRTQVGAPTAAICNCAETWALNQAVTLEGACSTHADPARSIVSYDWDFNYDGTFAATTTGINGTLPAGYPGYGTWPVALRVTDDTPAAQGGPRSSIATCGVVVKPPNNCPHARAGGPYSGRLDGPVSLDASASVDPDGDAMVYAWDFDNDGQFDDGVGVAPSITLSALGAFPLAVQVTDVRATQECAKVAYTTLTIGNATPVANPGGPYAGPPDTLLTLDGSRSSDPDGDPLSYSWDLDDDGSFGDSTAMTPTFAIPGNTPAGTALRVCLKVSDGTATSAAACTTVTANRPPDCVQAQPVLSAQCSGGVQEFDVDGRGSKDPDGDAISFFWSSTCPKAAFGSEKAAATSLTLSTGGVCTAGCVVTLTVRDDFSQASCSAEVSIRDTVGPSFSVPPADLTLECNPQQQTDLLAWLSSASASDACTAASLSHDFSGLSGGCGGETGSALVTWTATDDCGQSATTAATLAVLDTAAPQLTCPPPVTVECAGRDTAAPLTASADDACAGTLAPTTAAGGPYPRGTSTVTFDATDGCGNTGSCSTTVTVVDTVAPSITCPSDLTVECDAAGKATAVASGQATASDVCGAVTVSDPAAQDYPIGSTTLTHSATDEAGLTTNCTQRLSVVDSVAPVFDPASLAERSVAGNCTGTSVAFALPSASDLCGAVTVLCTEVLGNQVGSNPSTCSATDEAGLVVTAPLVVNVIAADCSDAGAGDGGMIADGGNTPPGGHPGCGCSAGGGVNGLLALLALARFGWRRRGRQAAPRHS